MRVTNESYAGVASTKLVRITEVDYSYWKFDLLTDDIFFGTSGASYEAKAWLKLDNVQTSG